MWHINFNFFCDGHRALHPKNEKLWLVYNFGRHHVAFEF